MLLSDERRGTKGGGKCASTLQTNESGVARGEGREKVEERSSLLPLVRHSSVHAFVTKYLIIRCTRTVKQRVYGVRIESGLLVRRGKFDSHHVIGIQRDVAFS